MEDFLGARAATQTVLSQREVEERIVNFLLQNRGELDRLAGRQPDKAEEALKPTLLRAQHEAYLCQCLSSLPESVQGLYGGQPWLVYWALQAADMLGVTEALYERVPAGALANFILSCLRDAGAASCGFAGGRLAQIPHLAATYAAVCSLCILEQAEALRAVPRAALKRWMLQLRQDDGSFCMHTDGETDIRASYCVAVIAALLQLDEVTAYEGGRDEALLTERTAAFVASCQTHEGGFACGNGASEAHGAYTQCGLAALILMRRPDLCNYAAVRRWLASRQLKYEGGFSGRTNKLVDSCYSHWVGASHVLLRVGEAYVRLLGSAIGPKRCVTAREVILLHHAQLIDAGGMRAADEVAWQALEEEERRRTERAERFATASLASTSPKNFPEDDGGDYYFNQQRLQLYVLLCCQDAQRGGLMDKPQCPNDAYHTCYSLSGMSSAQNLQYLCANIKGNTESILTEARRHTYIPTESSDFGVVLPANDARCTNSTTRLRTTNPVFNLHHSRVLAALRVWGVKPSLL